ncbi:MAG: hypothetical protein A2X18_07505 [Bacteroidetes bacterium GWF2_40_14]|nr:MAG: hypothetical protein A2X18_07505 [Bacteroidetes bacterium GWF2_40_14]
METTKEEVTEKELSDMQSYLETTLSDDPAELTERLASLNVYLARSGYLLAVAKNKRDKAVNGVFSEYQKMILKMPATVANKFIDSCVEKENMNVNWLDRMNRTCVHQGDNIRTLVSFSKEQLRLTKSGY